MLVALCRFFFWFGQRHAPGEGPGFDEGLVAMDDTAELERGSVSVEEGSTLGTIEDVLDGTTILIEELELDNSNALDEEDTDVVDGAKMADERVVLLLGAR